jgi:hypothetical protein
MIKHALHRDRQLAIPLSLTPPQEVAVQLVALRRIARTGQIQP